MKEQFTRYSAKLLIEAGELQEKKGRDYQSSFSTVRQADYYPNGVNSILDIVNAKVLRARSVLAAMEHGGAANFESVQDTMLDLINYASFLIAYMDGQVDGQQEGRDIFNRNIPDSDIFDPSMNPLIPVKFRKEPEAID